MSITIEQMREGHKKYCCQLNLELCMDPVRLINHPKNQKEFILDRKFILESLEKSKNICPFTSITLNEEQRKLESADLEILIFMLAAEKLIKQIEKNFIDEDKQIAEEITQYLEKVRNNKEKADYLKQAENILQKIVKDEKINLSLPVMTNLMSLGVVKNTERQQAFIREIESKNTSEMIDLNTKFNKLRETDEKLQLELKNAHAEIKRAQEERDKAIIAQKNLVQAERDKAQKIINDSKEQNEIDLAIRNSLQSENETLSKQLEQIKKERDEARKQSQEAQKESQRAQTQRLEALKLLDTTKAERDQAQIGRSNAEAAAESLNLTLRKSHLKMKSEYDNAQLTISELQAQLNGLEYKKAQETIVDLKKQLDIEKKKNFDLAAEKEKSDLLITHQTKKLAELWQLKTVFSQTFEDIMKKTPMLGNISSERKLESDNKAQALQSSPILNQYTQTNNNGQKLGVFNSPSKNIQIEDSSIVIYDTQKNGEELKQEIDASNQTVVAFTNFKSSDEKKLAEIEGKVLGNITQPHLKLSGETAVYFTNVFNHLKNNTSVMTLEISGMNLASNELVTLKEMFKTNRTIKTLKFSNIKDFRMDDFLEIISMNSNLTTLSLTNHRPNPENIEKLCDALKRNSTLQCLDLSNNKIEYNGAEKLFKFLSLNTESALHTINLSNNDINLNSVQMPNFGPNCLLKKLKRLDLNGNRVSEQFKQDLERQIKSSNQSDNVKIIQSKPKNRRMSESDDEFGE